MMCFGALYVLRMQQASLNQSMIHGGAATGFNQDSTLREFGSRQAVDGHTSTCEDVFTRDWRFEILRFAERGGTVVPGSVYVFGVYNGRTVKLLRQLFPSSPTWGFDSFRGLPEDTDPEPTRIEVQPGAYLTAHTAVTLRQSILTDESNPRRIWSGKKRQTELQLRGAMADWGGMVVPTGQLELEEGWFKDILTDETAALHRARSAAYVDMDVNLYNSTFQALDWMFGHGLVQKGTLIGYEGFWTLACVAYGDKSAGDHLSPLQTTAGRAHRDIAERYGVHFACVAGPCGSKRSPDPLDVCTRGGAVIFQVQSLRDAATTATETDAYESGFTMSGAEMVAYKCDEHSQHIRCPVSTHKPVTAFFARADVCVVCVYLCISMCRHLRARWPPAVFTARPTNWIM